MGLLLSTRNGLNFLRNLTEVARAKFSDEAFGGFFYRSVTKDIGEADLLLDGFLQYLSICISSKKRDTVHRLIEEVLKRHRIQMEEDGIKLSKRYEKDLPETIVPDELLKFILDAILQYGIKAVTTEKDMEFSTQSFILHRGASAGQEVFRKEQKYIAIRLSFAGYKKLGGQFAETPIFRKEPLSLMLLRLVREVVRKNRGIMKLERDERMGRISISLWFPSERRETGRYQPAHQFMN